MNSDSATFMFQFLFSVEFMTRRPSAMTICFRGITYGVFGLRNDIVHHLLTRFFIWFVEWSELIHHHPIPHS
jgi:hypothetical protein